MTSMEDTRGRFAAVLARSQSDLHVCTTQNLEDMPWRIQIQEGNILRVAGRVCRMLQGQQVSSNLANRSAPDISPYSSWPEMDCVCD